MLLGLLFVAAVAGQEPDTPKQAADKVLAAADDRALTELVSNPLQLSDCHHSLSPASRRRTGQDTHGIAEDPSLSDPLSARIPSGRIGGPGCGPG